MAIQKRDFEAAGVEFIDENGGGPGVRLRKRQLKTRQTERHPIAASRQGDDRRAVRQYREVERNIIALTVAAPT